MLALAGGAFFGCSSEPSGATSSDAPPGGNDAGRFDAASPVTSDASARDAASAKDDSGAGLEAGAGDAKLDATKPPFTCTGDGSFPLTLAIPEASAATEVELTAGVRELFVVADSGHTGEALLVALPSKTTRSLTLPLDTTASDDLEGAAWRDGHLYTLTSSGAVRRFSPNGTGGLTRDQNAYALGASPYACADLMGVNCGKDYEGLCLRATRGTHACDGYAASKKEAKLYCVKLDAAGVMSVDSAVTPIPLTLGADVLSDCAFGAGGGPGDDVLVVTTNVGNLNRSYRVDEATGALTQLPIGVLPNLEAIAIDKDGALYVFDDHQSAPSGSLRATCVGW